MTDPTPRQVLYALVSGGFLVVVGILVAGSAIAGLSPMWWTITMSILATTTAVWSSLNWRRTGRVLMTSIGLLVLWAVGTLLVG